MPAVYIVNMNALDSCKCIAGGNPVMDWHTPNRSMLHTKTEICEIFIRLSANLSFGLSRWALNRGGRLFEVGHLFEVGRLLSFHHFQ